MTHNLELDTLKIRLTDPKLASLDLRVRVQRVLRQLILEGILRPAVGCPPRVRWASHWAFPGIP